MKKQQAYGNDSISALKGADRVRKRPAVIFGSDGLDGCEHAVFEILSNAIDEAREGHGDLVIVTRYEDHSIEVEDFGRGCPVDWNEKEGRYNWELVFCELYAGGKYDNNAGGDYEFSLGLNGLGACATRAAQKGARRPEKDRLDVPLASRSRRVHGHQYPQGILRRYAQTAGGRERGRDVPLPQRDRAREIRDDGLLL